MSDNFGKNFLKGKNEMKKTLSIILAIAMIAAMALPMGIFASAEEVVEVATWADFVTACEGNYGEGSYKLTADVTADTPISSFTGIFDGNGHTVHVAATMFLDVSTGAVIKNFTTQLADIDVDNGDGTTSKLQMSTNPIVDMISGSTADFPVTLENITNNVEVIETAADQEAIGGIAGKVDADNYIIAKKLVNNANIATNDQAGGIFGNTGHARGHLFLLAANIVNNGNVWSSKNYAGGIVGNSNDSLTATFSYCFNNGDITAENDAGGILGHVGGNVSEVTFNYCASTGTICNNPVIDPETGAKLAGTDKTAPKYGAGGIFTRSDSAAGIITINNCVVTGAFTPDTTVDETGAVTASGSSDPFSAFNGGGLVTITDCTYLYGMHVIGEQAATLAEGASGFTAQDQVACDALIAAMMENKETADPGSFGGEGSDEGDDQTTAPDDDQTTAPDVDQTTAPDADQTTAKPGDDTTAKPADNTTKAPATTTAASDDGCGSSISMAVVAIAAVSAVAVVARKKED